MEQFITYIRKYSGFSFLVTYSTIKTPKGKMRTLSITNQEVRMADLEPTDTMILSFDDMGLSNNKKQLKELCEYIMKDLKEK